MYKPHVLHVAEVGEVHSKHRVKELPSNKHCLAIGGAKDAKDFHEEAGPGFVHQVLETGGVVSLLNSLL